MYCLHINFPLDIHKKEKIMTKGKVSLYLSGEKHIDEKNCNLNSIIANIRGKISSGSRLQKRDLHKSFLFLFLSYEVKYFCSLITCVWLWKERSKNNPGVSVVNKNYHARALTRMFLSPFYQLFKICLWDGHHFTNCALIITTDCTEVLVLVYTLYAFVLY